MNGLLFNKFFMVLNGKKKNRQKKYVVGDFVFFLIP